MRRMHRLVVVTAATLALAGVALASDFSDVYADYQSDNQITPCRFTKQQLLNAKQEAQSYPDGTYSGFTAEIDQEVARWDSGGCSGAAPPPSGSDPSADFSAVFADWRPDGVITRCRFTRQQLQNALDEAGKMNDIDAYAPGFRDAVRAELARNCAGVLRGAAAGGLKIVKIRAKGRDREYVTIKNKSKGKVSLKGLSLRDRMGKRVRLPRRKLGRGRKLRVITGCLGKRKRPVRRKGRFYACRKRGQLWNDKGDVVKIVDRSGKVLAQRGYKRFRGVPRF